MHLLLLALILNSCSFFIEKFQEEYDEEVKLRVKKKTFCENTTPDDLILIGKNRKLQDSFNEFLLKLRKRDIYLKSIEKSVIWSLVQINSRPDLSSATSRYQVILRIDRRDYFYDFQASNENENFPFLFGLDYILNKHSRQARNLSSLARLIDLYYPDSFFIDDDFSHFLAKNSSVIISNKTLNSFYTRGDELLQAGERIPKIRLAKLVQYYNQMKSKHKVNVSNKLFDFQKSKAYDISCNINLKLYSSSIFLISQEEIKAHTYGLKSKGFTYMASNAQQIQNFESLLGTPAFVGHSKLPMPNICKYRFGDRQNGYSMWLSSSMSRDPGQHLFHLYQYGLEQVKSVEDLDTLLRFSRHFFLSNPLRLIFESQRGTNEQLTELLTLNVPIYNALSLGNIWGYIHFSDNNDHFLLDDRNPGELSCLK